MSVASGRAPGGAPDAGRGRPGSRPRGFGPGAGSAAEGFYPSYALMLSARPARILEAIRNDGRVERAKLVDDLNAMIMEEVERQQGAAPDGAR